ncbi:hypothetical protein [Paenibacillus sp. QZ-Y1]|uniref:hypothetical protein n=1 Tax=Paenibacillus sp. QZ-Y1 TaxID=3414511 RepID=UPI003F7B2607
MSIMSQKVESLGYWVTYNYFEGEVIYCPNCKQTLIDYDLILENNWECPECSVKLVVQTECDGVKRSVERMLVDELEEGMLIVVDRINSIHELLSIQVYSQSTKLRLRGFGSIDAQEHKYYENVLGSW